MSTRRTRNFTRRVSNRESRRDRLTWLRKLKRPLTQEELQELSSLIRQLKKD